MIFQRVYLQNKLIILDIDVLRFSVDMSYLFNADRQVRQQSLVAQVFTKQIIKTAQMVLIYWQSCFIQKV